MEICPYDELPDCDIPAWCRDPVAGAIYELFGEKSFVIARSFGYSELQTLAATHGDQEQILLAKSDIVIKCGAPSENLCAIRFNDRKLLDPFLNHNPAFAGTLITSEQGVFTLWLRAKGPYPGDADLAEISWISSGVVILVERGKAKDTGYVTDAPPIQIEFERIVWAEKQINALADAQIAAAFGRPFIKNAANPRFWAAAFAQTSHYYWDPGVEEWWDGITGRPVVSTLTIKNEFTRVIMGFAYGDRRMRHALTALCHGRGWWEALNCLKGNAIKSQEGSFEVHFSDFLRANIETGCSGDVTVSEVIAAYAAHCLANNKYASPRQASSLIRPLMRALFGLQPSKSILRDRKEQNGFRRTRLKQMETTKRPNGVVGVAGVPG